MDLRFLHRDVAGQKVEVAALLRLADMGREERAIAALVMRLRRFPRRLAARQLVIRDGEMQRARGDVELDDIAIANQRQRSTDEGLRRGYYQGPNGAVDALILGRDV